MSEQKYNSNVSARGPQHRAFVLGSALRWRRPPWLDIGCLGLLAAAILLPLRGLYNATGSTMEEGFMLYFPERMIKGDIANVDFLHLYGPGSLDALAGWYGLFGHSLASERTFGLLQHLGVIFGIYALTRAWGRVNAVICALVCTVIVITPIALSAMAWEGGIAFGVWSLVFAIRALHIATGADNRGAGADNQDDETRRSSVRRNAIAAGVLAGFALSFRPDLVIALGIAHGWLLWRRNRASSKQFLAGLFVGVVPVIVHLLMAGIGPSFRGMVLDPVFHLRPGRELPRPPSFSKIDGTLQFVVELAPPWWRLPALNANHQLFLWFFAMLFAIGANIIVARTTLRRGNDNGRGVTLMMGALFGLGILPQALQRPDSTHLAWVVCISFSILPVAIVEVINRRRPALSHERRSVAAFGLVAALLFVVSPFYTYRTYLLHARVSVGNLPAPFRIERNGRQFWMGKYVSAVGSQQAIDTVAAMMKPGERLLVGPADLSRTIYSDVMFYYMLPELTPATYYIEMDPGLADKEGSSLAADVKSADWVILTNFWSGWFEPNASSKHGSQAPNRVVADDFCLIGNYQEAEVLLYHRCANGDGVSPAEVGERSAQVRAEGR